MSQLLTEIEESIVRDAQSDATPFCGISMNKRDVPNPFP